MSSKTSTAVGLVVAILIIGAIATLGFYQFEVAAKQTTASTATAPAVTCPSAQCANVTIPSGASTPPAGYTTGEKTTYGFTPDTITVIIGQNNTVFWTNNDASVHTATSDSGAFDSGNIDPSTSFQYTFTTPGTYTYHCTYHSWMQGTIIVKAGSSSGSTTASGSSSSSSSQSST